MTRKKTNKHIGSSFDDFLDEEGIQAEVTVRALKEVIAWQVAEAMKSQKLTKKEMADRMQTSRSSLDRLLDQSIGSLNIRTLDRAARALGKRVQFDLVDA